ncbi:MAG: DNA topoisomerase IB [Xanthomonadales bacterium]|nr:DNA topoisomerase IB [Xanthomonadales bacterium]
MRLRHVSDSEPGFSRRRTGDAFVYVDLEGQPIEDEDELARIRSLAIPPAYTDVWICRSANGHLQATGRDARGRKQYRYHPEWREARDATKFSRTIEFAERLPKLRRRIARDLRRRGATRERVLAALLRLLDRTFVRVGNEEYARDNASFGLSTLRNRHARVRGDEIRLLFRGKSGREHEVALEDRRVAAVLRRCHELPGQHLFQYVEDGEVHALTSGDVNDHLREIMQGDFTAKDFRTWAASVIVARELCGGAAEAVPDLKAAIAVAADSLGNTPTVCRRAYVHPALIEAASDPGGELCRLMGSVTRGRAGLDRHERALLRYLRVRERRRLRKRVGQSFTREQKASRPPRSASTDAGRGAGVARRT